MFNATVFQTMYDNATNAVSLPQGNPPLRTTDKELINEFTYYLHQRKSTFAAELISLKDLQQRSHNLIDYLKKEYDLK
ncbi:MAG: hypothetical protein ACR2FN_01800 [Chitinophagaceae bacterium]